MPKAVRTAQLIDKHGNPLMPDGALMRQAAGTWHTLIARVSSGIVLSYGKQGVKRAEIVGWIQHLRQVADNMEKFL